MSALDELQKRMKYNGALTVPDLEFAVFLANSEEAAAELQKYKYLEVVATDVNTWLKQTGLEGTGHQRELEKALQAIQNAKKVG